MNTPKPTAVSGISEHVTKLMRSKLIESKVKNQVIFAASPSEENKPLAEIKRLQFVQFHLPPIKSGEYEIHAEQTVRSAHLGKKNTENFVSPKQKFRIDSERYMLPPQYKHFVYPPDQDSGKYNDVLPHLIINRSTFPWERDSAIEKASNVIRKKGFSNKKDLTANEPAWLVLLLLTEEEAQKIPLVKKQTKEIYPAALIENDIESDKKTTFSFLEINEANKALVQSLLPRPQEVPYLAHTMITRFPKEQKKEEEEMSVLIANRFPVPGENHVVHLVSLEASFFGAPNKGEEWNIEEWNIDNWKGIVDQKKHLVSLYSWKFTCQKAGKLGFEQILRQEVNIAPLRMHTGGQKPTSSKVENLLKKGYVPMPHYLRKGEKTISWYHGPLVPTFDTWKSLKIDHSTSPDDYLLMQSDSKLLNVSYSAAWQLGRNLTLKNKRVAKVLYYWRKSNEQSLKRILLDNSFIGGVKNPNQEEKLQQIPIAVQLWVNSLMKLEHIPFNYLFPHPSMLPKESLRFVRVDYNWLMALLEGVLSVGLDGTVLGKKSTPIEKDYNKDLKLNPLSGFLLRSRIVNDYPDLHYKGWHEPATENSNWKEEEGGFPTLSRKIGGDIQFCLYPSKKASDSTIMDIKTVGIYGKPRGRHFGVFTEMESDKKTKIKTEVFKKRLRAYNLDKLKFHGKFIQEPEATFSLTNNTKPSDDILRENNTLDILKLVKTMDTTAKATGKINDQITGNSANFAFHLIEGTPRVLLFEETSNS